MFFNSSSSFLHEKCNFHQVIRKQLFLLEQLPFQAYKSVNFTNLIKPLKINSALKTKVKKNHLSQQLSISHFLLVYFPEEKIVIRNISLISLLELNNYIMNDLQSIKPNNNDLC